MTGDTVECYNCGRANPAWAQVCRSCGVALRPAAAAASSGPVPRDRESLISIGAGLGAIVAAVILGVLLVGIIPEAPAVIDASETPEPSLSPIASPSFDPSAVPSGAATPLPTPALIGTVTFGTGIDASTREATGVTDTFGPGTAFCHSVALSEPFGVETIQEEILRVEEDGSLTIVQQREGSNLSVNPNVQVAGFCAPNSTALIEGWGAGSFVLRDYRGGEAPELIAEGRFTLTE